MNIAIKKEIINYIKKHDPRGELISELSPDASYTSGKISYNKANLILHRNISVLKDEEYVRAYLVTKLVKELKYAPQNIELEREYEAGRPKTIKPRIDILVKDKRKKKEQTYLFVEVKAPDKFESDISYIEGQLFKLAAIEDKESPVKYLVYYSIQTEIESIADRLIIIDYTLYPSFVSWKTGGKISLDHLRSDYGAARKLIYVNKKEQELGPEERTLNRKVTAAYFTFLRKDLHDVLWGGGGMNYNDIFSNLVKLFLAKIFDEYVTSPGSPYAFQIGFKDDKPETANETYSKINALFKQAQKQFLGYSDDILGNSVGIDREKISENKVAYVVEQFQGISLIENENKDDGDLLGDFFEGIVSEGFKQDKGQFFTHQNIVQFILHALDIPQLANDLVNGKENPVKPRLPFICDPACGSGTFLIQAMKLITKSIRQRESDSYSKKAIEFVGANFPITTPNIWAKEFVYGCEINPDLGLATKVNMVLHGDGNINIFAGDPQGNGLNDFATYSIVGKVSVLSHDKVIKNYKYNKPVNEGFDVVISNPPFSIDKKALPAGDQLANLFLYYDKGNSENLFIERWYQLLKPGGRLGVVLPESVFDTSENLYIRLFIYKYFKVKAVISLPYLAFQPYTSTKTSLLFAQKKEVGEVEEYEGKWREFQNEYQRLQRTVKNYEKTVPANNKEVKNILIRYLRSYFDVADSNLPMSSLMTNYSEEIKEIHSNPDWWIFGEVSKHFNYDILLAEAEEIGYKRTKRGEQKRRNDLFYEDNDGQIAVNTQEPKSILDWIQLKISWN